MGVWVVEDNPVHVNQDMQRVHGALGTQEVGTCLVRTGLDGALIVISCVSHPHIATCVLLLQAADAFRAGGGGKRAQMKQLLAEAAVARRASGSKASTSGRDGAAAGAAAAGQKSNGSAAAAASGEKDWRLQGPGKKFMPEFKPGKC
jgi:hypothetical protein